MVFLHRWRGRMQVVLHSTPFHVFIVSLVCLDALIVLFELLLDVGAFGNLHNTHSLYTHSSSYSTCLQYSGYRSTYKCMFINISFYSIPCMHIQATFTVWERQPLIRLSSVTWTGKVEISVALMPSSYSMVKTLHPPVVMETLTCASARYTKEREFAVEVSRNKQRYE